MLLTLDTGATHSIIRSDLAGKKVEPLIGCKLRTATGEEASVLGKLMCKVQIGTLEVMHNFLVAEITDEVIIGMDFMLAQGLTLNLEKRMLTCRNVEILLSTGDEPFQIRNVTVSHHQQVPPKSEAVLWASVEGNCEAGKLWVVEPSGGTTNILVGRTLVKTEKSNKIPIRVMNEFKSAVIFDKGTVVAQCQAVEAIVNCDNPSQKCNDTLTRENTNMIATDTWLTELSEPEKSKA